MKTTKLANISEILSSVAIIVTLIYLVVEVKQNTDALHAQSRQSVLGSVQSELSEVVDKPNIAISIVKEGALTPEEQVQLHGWLVSAMRVREFSWLQYKSGSLDEYQWATEESVIRIFLQAPRIRKWWESMGSQTVGSDFSNFVTELASDLPVSDEYFRAQLSWANEPVSEGL